MSEIFDLEAWRQLVFHSLTALGESLAAFLPKLLGTLVLLGLGFAVARIVQALAARGLAGLGLDRGARHVGLQASLARAGIEAPPSRLLAVMLFWVLMLTFVLSAVETLGLSAVTGTIDRLIAFLPNLIAAALILLLGMLLARFARGAVVSGAVAANLPAARRLGAAAQGATVAVVAVLALEQVGIETAILVTALTALLTAFGVTVGVAFALGARPIVTHILAGHFLRQSLPPEGAVEVCGLRGVVERVGAVETLLRDGERAWSIPNGQLLDEIVAQ